MVIEGTLIRAIYAAATKEWVPPSQQTGQHLNKEAGALPSQTTGQSLSCVLGLCVQGFDGAMGKAVPELPARSPDSSTGPCLLSLAGLGSSSGPVGLRAERGSEGLTWVAQRVVGAHPWRHSGQAGQGSEHLVELWVSLLIARRLDQMVFKSPFQLKQAYDSRSTGSVVWCCSLGCPRAS